MYYLLLCIDSGYKTQQPEWSCLQRRPYNNGLGAYE